MQRQLFSLSLGVREAVKKIHKTLDTCYMFLETATLFSVGVAKITVLPLCHFSVKPSKKNGVGKNTLKHWGEISRFERSSRTILAPFYAAQRNTTGKLLFLPMLPLKSVKVRKAT